MLKPGPKGEPKHGNRTLYVPADKQELFEAAKAIAVLKGYGGISEYLIALLAADIAASKPEIEQLVARFNALTTEQVNQALKKSAQGGGE